MKLKERLILFVVYQLWAFYSLINPEDGREVWKSAAEWKRTQFYEDIYNDME